MPESPLLRLPRAVRLLVVPAALLLVITVTVFALAQWHPAKPEAPAAASGGSVTLGDPSRGAMVFATSCAGCHGDGGAGGGIGPRLAGNTISLAEAKATIDGGSGVMPAEIVEGTQEEDVLAYLATILAQPHSPRDSG